MAALQRVRSFARKHEGYAILTVSHVPFPRIDVPPMPSKTSPLRDEIKQNRPFQSAAHEALLSLLRTSAVVQRQLALVVEPSGVTMQQYNVLRILRGAGNEGLPTLAIRDRMIEEASGITRLLDKLERASYVVRERSTPDRRQVVCRITPPGLALLEGLDASVDATNDQVMHLLDTGEHKTLSEMLGAIRAACQRGGEAQRSSRNGQPPR